MSHETCPANGAGNEQPMSILTGNFYPTLAQVLPVLLLALIWDSAYLIRLRRQRRPLRRDDPAGVWFWTNPEYALTSWW
jgi:hypothetical protein